MLRSILQAVRESAHRRRFWGLLVSAVAALGIGFVAVSPARAEKLIQAGGYYYMFGLFVAFAYYAGRVAGPRREVWRPWLRRPGWPALVILAAAAFAIWSDPYKHKILFDEYVLQGTAFQMHATKEVGTIVRAYNLEGTWQPMDMFLDKRPYFFTFLVSLVHDFTGYRLANIFAVNSLLLPVLLGLVYWLARTVTSRGPALLAVGLLATLPLVGQQATGAGMDLHNLTMIAVVTTLAVLFLRAPDDDRLSLLILGTILLAQSRYESVIFVGPVVLVVLIGWWRAGQIFLPWPVVIAPLLLVPYAWHNRVVTATPLLWQLGEGQTARFGFNYLAGNLEGARKFLFNFGPNLANSWILSLLGVLGLGAAAVTAVRWWRRPDRPPAQPALLVLAIFGGGVLADAGVLKFFYYWGRFDDVVASRLALPLCLWFALLAAYLVHVLGRGRAWALPVATGSLAVWLLGWGLPAMARRTYTDANLVMQEVEWEYDQIRRRPGPVLYISNKSTIPFILWRMPALINTVGRLRGEQIKYHLREGTIREVIVSQTLRPTSAQGEMGVEPGDLMPPNYRLEPFATKRFGGRWIRLSRIVAIEKRESETPAPPPAESGTKAKVSGRETHRAAEPMSAVTPIEVRGPRFALQ